jgi:hypothetical protein
MIYHAAHALSASVAIWGELKVQRREKEKIRVIYEREVCPLLSSPASGQLYIYMQYFPFLLRSIISTSSKSFRTNKAK